MSASTMLHYSQESTYPPAEDFIYASQCSSSLDQLHSWPLQFSKLRASLIQHCLRRV